ncbi:MAG: prepilin-type cleavage/methylation domain-containing protein [Thermoplasmata archaeon]
MRELIKKTYFQLKSTEGISLAEIMIAILVSIIILGTITSLYITSNRVFLQTKAVADVKDTAKQGMAGLEWIMQRWGTSTPCNDPSGNNNCLEIRDCRRCLNPPTCNQFGDHIYPPPSSMCITITDGNPCDEVVFYGNLYGNGFVERISGPTSVALVSCRLSSATADNCYHIKRGGLFIRNMQDNNVALFFSLSSLSANNLDCIQLTGASNATASRTVTALNGYVPDANNVPTEFFRLEGGDLLLRVPHRIKLFCQDNPQDGNRRWLYMEATDMAENCNNNETAQPLIPVNSFNIEQVSNGVRITMEVRGTDGRTVTVQRYFGR